MPAAERVIENPVSGERIVIRTAAAETDGKLMEWDLFLAPGGRVPSSHCHPGQVETFTVLEGRLRFRIGLRRVIAGPGDQVRVAANTVHHFANAGRETVHVAVRTEPALNMEELLATAAALGRNQVAAGRRLPHLIDLALFVRDFAAEVRAPVLPPSLVAAALQPVVRLARRFGWDRRYRRARDSGAGRR
ncbi:cupin domain-containing protein [Actinoplanes sp. NPDC051411]|uniref:cupin domain-containing protein n=1 Tax=Actinoplanes sp. NPDC051411 TaxID=3155522 RepID=UPI003441B9B3